MPDKLSSLACAELYELYAEFQLCSLQRFGEGWSVQSWNEEPDHQPAASWPADWESGKVGEKIEQVKKVRTN